MSARSLFIRLLAVGAVALAAPWLRAQDGLPGALPWMNHGSHLNLTAPFEQTLAVADFDNDHKLDGAVLLDAGRAGGATSFRIQFHLSASNNAELTFESAEPRLAIRALDVNHDGAIDVVVEHPFTHKRLYVWLNDGNGAFHKGRIEDFPSAEVPGGGQVQLPSLQTDCPAVCLPQQRGTEMMMLASSSVRGRPPSLAGLGRLLPACSVVSRRFYPVSSRAPPSISL